MCFFLGRKERERKKKSLSAGMSKPGKTATLTCSSFHTAGPAFSILHHPCSCEGDMDENPLPCGSAPLCCWQLLGANVDLVRLL